MNNSKLKPILKWAGGKRQLLPDIRKHYPRNFNTYFEPFLGGGAVLLDLQPKKAIINDINDELINVFLTVRDHPQKLINLLRKYNNNKDEYYLVRGMDRLPIYDEIDSVIRASRIIFLNKTCYNGLYRVNKKGYFNVPFGHYKNPEIVNEEAILMLSNYLNTSEIKIYNGEYKNALKTAGLNDFVYLDPPYDPINKTSSFTSYSDNGFSKDDQIELYKTFCELDKRGCKVLLSNSATDFILDLYKEYKDNTFFVNAKRNINSKVEGRGKIKEVLIKNYE